MGAYPCGGLSAELARRYGVGTRVNAIAPNFFVGEQNRALLLNDDGSLTERGQTIVDHTSAGRFGEPEELESNKNRGHMRLISATACGPYRY